MPHCFELSNYLRSHALFHLEHHAIARAAPRLEARELERLLRPQAAVGNADEGLVDGRRDPCIPRRPDREPWTLRVAGPAKRERRRDRAAMPCTRDARSR